MKYKFYTTSEKAWQAMREAVLEAKHSIYLESYILVEDELTKDFFKAIKEKAATGVKVKIIVDRLGSFWGNFLRGVNAAEEGIEILFFRRFFLFSGNHRKVLIIDERVVFIGGVNISGKYAKWLDLHIRLEGKFLIRKILQSFAGVYKLAGGADPEIGKYLKRWRDEQPRLVLYEAKIFLIEHWPFRKRSALISYYKKKISEAKKSIVIVTPYFIPHRWLIGSLDAAVKRGVVVEILLPRKTDIVLLDAANWIFAEELSRKIKFLFFPEMNHAKILLIDDKEGMVGSNNIDSLSFDLNLEAGIIFKRKDMLADLKEILKKWRKSAVPFENLSPWHPRYYRILKFFIKLIKPIL